MLPVVLVLLHFLWASSDFNLKGCRLPPDSLKLNDGRYAPVIITSRLLGVCNWDDFQIQKTIGKGNFGRVVKAVHMLTGRTVAIKFQQNLSNDWFHFIRNEECIHAELSYHKAFPYIVEHYCTIISDNGAIGYVMEYVDGENLQDLYKRKSTEFSIDRVDMQKVMAQLAVTLDYLHSRKITMADLKAGNIMITRDGDIKLHDFGLATKTFPDGGIFKPSQWVSHGIRPEYGNWPNVDWYAYGLVLYEVRNRASIFEELKGPRAYLSPLIRGGFCPRSFDPTECDFIEKFSRTEWERIWGVTAETRKLVRQHEFFKGFDWASLDQQLAQFF